MKKDTKVKINTTSQTKSRFTTLFVTGIAFIATSYAINEKLVLAGSIA